jgi:putative hydrolase of the HAD superfamily
MGHVKAVIFDLDNVLYDEIDYVHAAFRSIAAFISGKSSFSEDEIFAKLVCDFKKKGSMYPRLFNDALTDIGLDQEMLPEILRLYGSVDVDLKLFPESENILLTLRQNGLKLALVTNGNVEFQQNKIRLLGIEKFFDVIVYARETPEAADKPNPASYKMAIERLGVSCEETLCVGDNPYTDFWGANKMGMRTVRLLFGEFKDVRLSNEYEAEIALSSFEQLLRSIEAINHQF